MFSEVRNDFNIPDNICYLSCSTLGPQLKKSTETAHKIMNKKEHPWTIQSEDFFETVENLQNLLGKLLNVPGQNIALTPSVSYGISTAANIIGEKVSPGEILVLDHQFPSNIFPWVELKKRGFSIRTLQRNLSEDLSTQVLNSVTKKTKIVASGNVHWSDGHALDLEMVSQELSSLGIIYLVDGIQSAGVMPTDLQKSPVSFFSGGMYKWLLGPYGLSYLYVNDSFCDGPSLDPTWMSRKNSDKFGVLTNYESHFRPGASRYDMGGKSSFINVALATSSMDWILNQGVENFQEAIRKKTDWIAERANNLGLVTLKPELRSPHILAIWNPNGGWSEDFQSRLVENNIFVSFRGDSMRVAPHVYNSEKDLEKLVEFLKAEFQ